MVDEVLKDEINKGGNRLTKQREVILDYLHSVTCHPTAETVHAEVKQIIPDISLATVYRNLKYLVENGFILQINTNDGKSRYDGNSQYHFHFICKSCGKVYDIWQVSKKIAADVKFLGQVDTIECNAYGICKQCLGNKCEIK